MYTKEQLRRLLIPLMFEQVLTALMGSVDTIMVTNIGSVAISAVSLVDSLNILIINIFAAMATGGAIICAQYLGSNQKDKANQALKQLIFSVTLISILITIPCILFRRPLLTLIFGSVEKNVMDNALNYLFITALSYPFIALYNAGAASFRTSQNSRLPMAIAFGSNILNILGNIFFIFTLSLGVAGAALSTLLSRIISAIIILILLKQPKQDLYVDSYLSIRPEIETITKILKIGIPTGIENGMFQFGKLVIQSTVSTMGTTAIAAQAMVAMLESFACQASIGIGLGMMTVVGKCVGAKEYEQARHYTISLTKLAWMVCIIFCAIIMLFIQQITSLAGMEAESAKLAIWLTRIVFAYKMIFWTPSFLPGYGLRAAGDVKFSMITSTLSMWICRVVVTIFLVHQFQMGPLAVWIGMGADWTIRSFIFLARFKSNKWLEHKVI